MTSPVNEDIPASKRERELVHRLHEIEKAIANLLRERNAIKVTLGDLYPQVHNTIPAPKDRGTVISVLNFEALSYDAQAYVTTSGARLRDACVNGELDGLILSLCTRDNGVNVSKLLKLKQLRDVDSKLKSRVYRLHRDGFLRIEFTKTAVTI